MGNGTELGAVRGLGSAHHGTHDWLSIRTASVAILILSSFVVFSLVMLPNFSHAMVAQWLSRPLSAGAMALLVIALFWHTRLGVAEMIGDYVHHGGNKFAALLALNLATFGGAAFGLICIARIALGGGAA